jgi:hypothetical protein
MPGNEKNNKLLKSFIHKAKQTAVFTGWKVCATCCIATETGCSGAERIKDKAVKCKMCT